MGGGPKPDIGKLDEKYMRKLAKNLGKAWIIVATELLFESAEIENFKSDIILNQAEQAFQMLVTWWRKQTDHIDARDRLIAALREAGRADFVLEMPDNLTVTSEGMEPQEDTAIPHTTSKHRRRRSGKRGGNFLFKSPYRHPSDNLTVTSEGMEPQEDTAIPHTTSKHHWLRSGKKGWQKKKWIPLTTPIR